MPVSFETRDNEFAVATGRNVNGGRGTSVFDYPPNSSKDLTVTANEGDPSPYTFEIGDTYDVTYGGRGGGGTLEDAVVIRSDIAPGGGGGIVVFSGTDADSGEETQVVWTPDFNLEGWYWDNFDRGKSPQFWTSDQQDANYAFVCFAADTPILTPEGERAAGDLRVGDQVMTRDHGAQPILWLGRRTLSFDGSNAAQRPVAISAHAFGAESPRQALRLSPQHRLLLEIDGAATFVAAKGLLGHPAVSQDLTCDSVTYISILCPTHTVIRAAGLPCESFYPGPQGLELLGWNEKLALAAVYPGVLEDPEAYGPLAHPVIGPSRFARLHGDAIRPACFDPLPAAH